jgi:hypothetical protein
VPSFNSPYRQQTPLHESPSGLPLSTAFWTQSAKSLSSNGLRR